MCDFYTVLFQIHCLQKIGMLDLCLIKLFQTNKGAIFCLTVYISMSTHHTKTMLFKQLAFPRQKVNII